MGGRVGHIRIQLGTRKVNTVKRGQRISNLNFLRRENKIKGRIAKMVTRTHNVPSKTSIQFITHQLHNQSLRFCALMRLSYS